MATLRLLHSLNFAWGQHEVLEYAIHVHVDIIQWEIDHGSPWMEAFCKIAAFHGQCDTLNWSTCQWMPLRCIDNKVLPRRKKYVFVNR